MKTRLGTRTGSKNPRKRVQNAPEHESVFGIQEHHSTLKRAKFPPFGLSPNPLGDDKAHPFDLFAEGCIQIRILIIHAYFLESSGLYK